MGVYHDDMVKIKGRWFFKRVQLDIHFRTPTTKAGPSSASLNPCLISSVGMPRVSHKIAMSFW
jgi:hypothetical protein